MTISKTALKAALNEEIWLATHQLRNALKYVKTPHEKARIRSQIKDIKTRMRATWDITY